MSTGISTPMPNGVLMIEGNAVTMTAEGPLMHKISGLGMSTGKVASASSRGAAYYMTSSPKLMSLNNIVGVWEYEQDEKGDFSLKVRAWK